MPTCSTPTGPRGVVTGTLLDGRLKLGEEVEILLRTLAVIYDEPPSALAEQLIAWGVLNPEAIAGLPRNDSM